MNQDWTYTFGFAKGPEGLNILGRSYFDRVVSSLPLGQEGIMTLAPKKDTRTNAQNRMMWGHVYDQLLTGLASELGYERNEKDYLHEALCRLYGGTVEDKATGLTVRKFRTSKATKKEFTDYIEWLARWAAQEHGVVIALPGEVA